MPGAPIPGPIYVGGRLSGEPLPTGALPLGPLPTGILPAGSLPTGPLPGGISPGGPDEPEGGDWASDGKLASHSVATHANRPPRTAFVRIRVPFTAMPPQKGVRPKGPPDAGPSHDIVRLSLTPATVSMANFVRPCHQGKPELQAVSGIAEPARTA